MKSLIIHRSGKLLIAAIIAVFCVIIIKTCGWVPTGIKPAGISTRKCPLSAVTSDSTLRIGILPNAAFLPGIVQNQGLTATGKSFFSITQGIRVDFVIIENWDLGCKYLLGGRLDALWTTPGLLARSLPVLRPINPVIFMLAATSRGAHAVYHRGTIKSPVQLKGKRISCVRRSPSCFFLVGLLMQCGISEKEVQWLYAPTEALAAHNFNNHRADCYAGPVLEKKLHTKEGNTEAILISTADAPGVIAYELMARESNIRDRREAFEKFVTGWMEGVNRIKKDPSAALEAAGMFLNSRKEEMEKEMGLYEPADLAANCAFFRLIPGDAPDIFVLLALATKTWGKGSDELNNGFTTMSADADIITILGEKSGLLRMQYLKRHPFSPPQAAGSRHFIQISKTVLVSFTPDKTTITRESMAELKEISRTASLFPSSFISLYPVTRDSGFGNSSLDALVLETVKILASEHKIPHNRIHYAETLIHEKNTVAGKHDGVFVAITLMRKTEK